MCGANVVIAGAPGANAPRQVRALLRRVGLAVRESGQHGLRGEQKGRSLHLFRLSVKVPRHAGGGAAPAPAPGEAVQRNLVDGTALDARGVNPAAEGSRRQDCRLEHVHARRPHRPHRTHHQQRRRCQCQRPQHHRSAVASAWHRVGASRPRNYVGNRSPKGRVSRIPRCISPCCGARCGGAARGLAWLR